LETNQELCVNVVNNATGATMKRTNDTHIVLEEICLQEIEKKDDDPRESIRFQLEKDTPVKVQIAIGEKRTIIRLVIHKIVSDLNSIALIGCGFATGVYCLRNNLEFPQKTSIPNVCATLKSALLPKWEKAERFWESHIKASTQPTFIGDSKQLPNADCFKTEEMCLSVETFVKVTNYLQEKGLTLFQLMASIYQLMLHLETSLDQVVVTTAVDMRVHVPELSNIITRCINVVPLVSNLKLHDKLHEYVSENGKSLARVFENSYYPQELILAKIKDEEARSNLGRHYLVMNKMETVNETLVFNEASIKRVCTRRKQKETAMYVSFDMKRNEAGIDLCYDSSICGEDGGTRMMSKLLWLLETVIENKFSDISTILQIQTSSRETKIASLPNTATENSLLTFHQNGTTENGPSSRIQSDVLENGPSSRIQSGVLENGPSLRKQSGVLEHGISTRSPTYPKKLSLVRDSVNYLFKGNAICFVFI